MSPGMSSTITIDKRIYSALIESFGEDTLKEKIDCILLAAMENLIERYSREILNFEEKYGYSFDEFDKMWSEGKIKNKQMHEVEADFIDWEMLEMEKRDLLPALSRLIGLKKI
ncbi:MAG: hypothetical protein HY786_03145 [Deltaproteobacteria bacterium]|nr:hypothetical protein [Deltaproteobacteria bacterium]